MKPKCWIPASMCSVGRREALASAPRRRSSTAFYKAPVASLGLERAEAARPPGEQNPEKEQPLEGRQLPLLFWQSVGETGALLLVNTKEGDGFSKVSYSLSQRCCRFGRRRCLALSHWFLHKPHSGAPEQNSGQGRAGQKDERAEKVAGTTGGGQSW